MPQFDFGNPTVWAQVFWLGVCFAVLYFGIVKLTLPKLARTLDARETQVTGDIATAEAAKADADALASTYAAGIEDAQKAARAKVTEAKAKATASIDKTVAAVNEKLLEKVVAAEAALSLARAKALGEIEGVATDTAADIVERLTGNRPDSAIVKKAAGAAMAA
jgi:F-type H+-transporting ATPase subunit b